MDQPIACTLTAADYAVRTKGTRELARRALRSREPIPAGARLTFEGGADTERQLREFIVAEARCCSFLRMDLRPADDALVLDVTGPAEADSIIAELFA
jgi:hypothetical protein